MDLTRVLTGCIMPLLGLFFSQNPKERGYCSMNLQIIAPTSRISPATLIDVTDEALRQSRSCGCSMNSCENNSTCGCAYNSSGVQ